MTFVAICDNKRQPNELNDYSDVAKDDGGRVIELDLNNKHNIDEKIKSIFMELTREICQNIDDKKWNEENHDNPQRLEKFGIKISIDKDAPRPIIYENKK